MISRYGQGSEALNRSPAEIKAQVEYEYRLREQAQQTIRKLREEGRVVRVVRSSNHTVGNRGITVLPVPRITETGHLAWTVR